MTSLPSSTPIYRKSTDGSVLGVFAQNNQIFLFYRHLFGREIYLSLEVSSNGIDFHPYARNVVFEQVGLPKLAKSKIGAFAISKLDSCYFLTFKYQTKAKEVILAATSSDLVHWQPRGKLPSLKNQLLTVLPSKYQGEYLGFIAGEKVRVVSSTNLKKWRMVGEFSELSEHNQAVYQLGNTLLTTEGIFLFYFKKQQLPDQSDCYAIYGALFDKNNPKNLIWNLNSSLFEYPKDQPSWGESIKPIGMVTLKDKLVSYWQKDNQEILAIFHPLPLHLLEQKKEPSFSILKKFKENPIIAPISEHFWESKATFNPAAVYDDDKVHIVYRAIGDGDLSMLGYASSTDGIHIDERLAEPIYLSAQPSFGQRSSPKQAVGCSPYTSGGGGNGGCEDPRLTKIGDRYYMTYVAYDGASPPRVALTSIARDDFLAKKWNFAKPVFISSPDAVNKNAVIFPEKIADKYVIMHRVFPNILIDFVDSLDFDGQTFLRGEYQIFPRTTSWDSRKIGAGAPPIKTEYGWLLIYHAVGEDEPGKYKIGAMLLDLYQPTQVIARSVNPILLPEEPYENEGFKAGVVYPCGAVTFADKLFVYYGGADTVACAATAHLSVFLDQLLENSSVNFEQVTTYHSTLSKN